MMSTPNVFGMTAAEVEDDESIEFDDDNSSLGLFDGWLRMCDSVTNRANISSCTLSTTSRTTQRMSKRDRIGSLRSTFSENVSVELYLVVFINKLLSILSS